MRKVILTALAIGTVFAAVKNAEAQRRSQPSPFGTVCGPALMGNGKSKLVCGNAPTVQNRLNCTQIYNTYYRRMQTIC